VSPDATREQLERFRATIGDRLGLRVADDRLGDLATLLASRFESSHEPSIDTYLTRLSSGGGRDELRALVTALTVGETFFMRSPAQFDALAALVPASMARRARKLRILSAGCASGEEPYSVAILALERFPQLAPLLEIVAVDANIGALEKASAARYSPWSMRDMPPALVKRWFVAEGRELVLSDVARQMVVFAERNLAEDDSIFWSAGAFDVIFCRNVLMYFSEVAARAVVARFARAIPPGGHLFLGHAESLRGVSVDFELCHTHETFYYRRCDASRASSSPTLPRRPADAVADSIARLAEVSVDESSVAPDPTAWIDAIQRSSDHIEKLARGRDDGRVAAGPTTREAGFGAGLTTGIAPQAPTPGLGSASPAEGLPEILALLREERFADAIARLRALPSARLVDVTVQTMLAIALTNSGQVAEAREVCARILSVDPRGVGAHFLLALCAELAGDDAAALEHARTASGFDPTFGMPHLHLGLLARRAGDHATAQAELARALVLLRDDDEARVALFGGGFGRDALVRVCEAELRAIQLGGKRAER
jgi:chemotaxis protein methyltransferase CheR